MRKSLMTVAKSIAGVLFLLAFVGHGVADELPYSNSEEAEAFFDSKEHIAIIVRISGGLGYREYEHLRNEYDSEMPGSSEKWEVWDKEINQSPAASSDYVVLKNFKGELAPLITMPNDYATAFRLQLAEPYLVFLDASQTNTYTLTAVAAAQTFHVDYFPDGLLAQSNAEELAQWLLNHLPIPVFAP